jgi:serine protease Do
MSKEKNFFQKNKTNIVIGAMAGVISAVLVNIVIIGLVFTYPKESKEFLQTTLENLGIKQEMGFEHWKKDFQKEDKINIKQVTSQESLVIETVKKANPAVVSIIITKDVPIIERYYEESPFNNPFGDFFGDDFFSPFSFRLPKYREKGTEKKEIGGGSGFIVSSDGLIITNRHVVDNKDVEYTVFTNDGQKHIAKVIALDPINDIAVIKINKTDLPFLEFADSEQIEVGQSVIAIGNALGEFRNTVSVGVISGLARSVRAGNGFGQSEQLEGVIQTDAAINRGNSGGPLLNLSGQVIGVNVAMAVGSENIGFALPSNLVKTVVNSVKESGKIVRPFLGVRYIMINEEIKEKNKLQVDYGALIVRGETREELAVMPGSAADKADIEEGDIILEVDGLKVGDGRSLALIIASKQVGDEIELKILRKGEEIMIKAKLQEMPE